MKALVQKMLLVLVVTCALTSCNRETQSQNDDNHSAAIDEQLIYVTNESTRFLAENLLGESFTVTGPVATRESFAKWIPNENETREIQRARLIIDGSVGSAEWMIKVTLPESRKYELTKPIVNDLIEVADLTVHKHGPEGEHSHAGQVSQVWMDPQLLQKQASALAAIFAKQLDVDQTQLDQNLAKLNGELGKLAEDLKTINPGENKINTISNAPIFKYLCRAANLDDQHFHWDVQKSLDEKKLEQLDAYLKTTKPRIVLLSSEPCAELKQQLQSRGLEFVVLDLCDYLQEGGGYPERLTRNVELLKEALGN